MEKVNIADMFRNSTLQNNQNSKFTRIWNSLKWRQLYQNSEEYRISMENEEEIVVKQILNGELKGFGTGTLVWPAAHIMVKYLEKRFRETKGLVGKHVCDIGSGTGITGFAAALLGATVVLTDQQQLIPFLQENKLMFCAHQTKDSSLADKLRIELYDWGGVVPTGRPFDYVLVSDCVLPKLYPIDMLMKGVEAVMDDHTVAIFSYEHRPYPEFDPREEFERLALLHGLSVKVVPLAEHHELFCAEDIEIWEVRRVASAAGEERSLADQVTVRNWGTVPEVSVNVAGKDVSIRQLPTGAIGAVLWPSSVVVSRFLLQNPFHSFAGRSSINVHPRPLAVDLGAGCGLTSMALHSAGYEVVATDKANVLHLLQENVDRWLARGRTGDEPAAISVQELDWFSSTAGAIPTESVQFETSEWRPRSTLELSRTPDLVVCSDCLYSSASVQPLIEVLDSLVGPSTMVLLVNEMRTALEEFLYLAARHSSWGKVKFTEIPLLESQLELFRGGVTGRMASPPLRMCLMTVDRKPI